MQFLSVNLTKIARNGLFHYKWGLSKWIVSLQMRSIIFLTVEAYLCLLTMLSAKWMLTIYHTLNFFPNAIWFPLNSSWLNHEYLKHGFLQYSMEKKIDLRWNAVPVDYMLRLHNLVVYRGSFFVHFKYFLFTVNSCSFGAENAIFRNSSTNSTIFEDT